MIPSNELCIGNTVLFNFQEVRVDELLQDQIFFSWPGIPFGKMTYDFATPIPITKEWLLRLGFEKDTNGMSYYIGRIVYNFWPNGSEGFECEDYNYSTSLNHVKHVHQVQNLILFFTGKKTAVELTPPAAVLPPTEPAP